MSKGIIYLSEDQIIEQMLKFLTDCDSDTLAKFAGDSLGGECLFNIETKKYEFTPNKNYCGAFDKTQTERVNKILQELGYSD